MLDELLKYIFKECQEQKGLRKTQESSIEKHQQIIEKLVEENERLRRILMEDLKIPSRKLEASSSGRTITRELARNTDYKLIVEDYQFPSTQCSPSHSQ